MEHTVVAKVIYRDPGDSYDTVKQVELGAIEINSKEKVEEVAKKIADELNINEGLRYESYNEKDTHPTDFEFYLKTPSDEEWSYSEMYKIVLVDCLNIKGRLFVLKPFSLHD